MKASEVVVENGPVSREPSDVVVSCLVPVLAQGTIRTEGRE